MHCDSHPKCCMAASHFLLFTCLPAGSGAPSTGLIRLAALSCSHPAQRVAKQLSTAVHCGTSSGTSAISGFCIIHPCFVHVAGLHSCSHQRLRTASQACTPLCSRFPVDHYSDAPLAFSQPQRFSLPLVMATRLPRLPAADLSAAAATQLKVICPSRQYQSPRHLWMFCYA